MKTLAFVIPTIGTGGAERVVVSLARALSKHYNCMILISKGSHRHYTNDDLTVVEIEYTLEGFRNAIKEHSIDVISDHFHWNRQHVIDMAGLADEGMPIVLTEHNAFHYPQFQRMRREVDEDIDWIDERYQYYAKFACITVLNDDAHAFFRTELQNVETIFNPLPLSPQRHSDPEAKALLNVSHFFKKAKRLDYLYASFAKVLDKTPDASLSILGNYDWLTDAYYRKATGVHGAQIKTPGLTKLVDMYYEQSSIFVMTSEIEGQPMVLLEAAQYAMPQVCFDIPGLSDQIVDGITGHLVPFGDVDGFADCLNDLLGNPRRIAQMGRAAREFIEAEFNLDKIISTWVNVIETALEGKKIISSKKSVTSEQLKKKAWFDAFWSDRSTVEHGPMPPKISFLVPVYGTEELLGRCLRSIQAQTLQEFECIVVNDASPGDVTHEFDKVVGDDSRFRLVHHDENRGLYQARSTAAAHSRGQFLANIDSDDYIDCHFAEIMYQKALVTGAEIVECKAIEFDVDGSPIHFANVDSSDPVDGENAAAAFFNGSLRNVVWNKIYSKELWDRVPEHNQFDVGLSICEDTLRNSFLFPHCKRYAAVPDCLYFYCRRPSSVVKGGDFQRLAQKIADINFVYQKSSEKLGDLGHETAWKRLQKKWAQDIAWYVAETVERYGLEDVQEHMWRLRSKIDEATRTQIELGARIASSEVYLQERIAAWSWEMQRADGLERRLNRLKTFIENEAD